MQFDEIPQVLERLTEMQEDGLVELDDQALRVTADGRMFVRNICMAFDLRLWRHKPATRIFSMTI